LKEKYERVKVCPDSGACRFVAPRDFAPAVNLESSPSSRKGVGYRVANGNIIPNRGQKKVRAVDSSGNTLKSLWQISDVTKPLGGVIESVRAGNRVVFDQDDNGENTSYMFNKRGKVLIPIELEEDRDYVYDLYIPKAENVNCVKDDDIEQPKKSSYRGQWEAFNDSYTLDMSQDFTRRV
jgi:hypothetical protein